MYFGIVLEIGRNFLFFKLVWLRGIFGDFHVNDGVFFLSRRLLSFSINLSLMNLYLISAIIQQLNQLHFWLYFRHIFLIVDIRSCNLNRLHQPGEYLNMSESKYKFLLWFIYKINDSEIVEFTIHEPGLLCNLLYLLNCANLYFVVDDVVLLEESEVVFEWV